MPEANYEMFKYSNLGLCNALISLITGKKMSIYTYSKTSNIQKASTYVDHRAFFFFDEDQVKKMEKDP